MKAVKPQIYGLHFSGGSSYSLQHIFANLKDDFDIKLLELPGRGKRLDEPLLYKKDEAVLDLLRQITESRKNVPYIIYGHSLGAELGFAVIRELELLQDAPVYFIPTGNCGPNVHERRDLSTLQRLEFFNTLKDMGGISEELLQNEDLIDFFEPILRADFKLLENNISSSINFSINTPIHAIMGSDEKYSENITNWSNYTSAEFSYQLMKGNHFFINQHQESIALSVKECIISGIKNKY